MRIDSCYVSEYESFGYGTIHHKFRLVDMPAILCSENAPNRKFSRL